MNDNRRMPARLSAFVIWALVAATATFWALRLFARSPAAPAHAVAVGDALAMRGDLTRLLGAPPLAATPAVVVPEIASRFKLTGVMAPKTPDRHGVALISVDGKMPRAFHVGARVDGELVLQSVSLRTAAIGPVQGKTAVVLELPPPTPAAIGTLPPNWKPYLDKLPNDPWGKAYQYANPGVKGEIDVYSLGADGVVGGEGKNADIGSWQ